ncbi:MAG: type II CRISPR-associated endonuclease Cas1 [Planctomycetaceae bacterium]
MIKRTVVVSTPGTLLRSRQGQMELVCVDEVVARIPFEDLGFLVLESDQVQISTGALASAVEVGAATILCDAKHLPAGLLLALEGNSLQAQRLEWQIAASMPLRKQVWRRVVESKIRMQAANLPSQPAASERLYRLASETRSGDPSNREAQAARVYWKALFEGISLPAAFRRERDGPPPNGLLNYGYAILRAAVARAICLAGLHPSIGIHHENRCDSFRLADDLMEPFRPLVDRAVLGLAREGHVEVSKETKRPLLALLSQSIPWQGQSSPLLVALQRCAASLCMAIDPGAGGTAGVRAQRVELPYHRHSIDAAP